MPSFVTPAGILERSRRKSLPRMISNRRTRGKLEKSRLRAKWTLGRLCETCARYSVKLTRPRRLLLQALIDSDHPDIYTLMEQARSAGSGPLGLARTYHFLDALQEIGALERLTLSTGPDRYELAVADSHDHMIELSSGKVMGFRSPKIIEILSALATRHGCRLLRYKLEVVVESKRSPTSQRGSINEN